MFEPIIFTVHGTPVPQGSKNPVPVTYKDKSPVRRHKKGCPAKRNPDLANPGKGMPDPSDPSKPWRPLSCDCPIMVNTVEDNAARLKPWREAIGYSARAAYKGDLIDGLLDVRCVFYKPRPKGHYGTGRNADLLKDSAPAAPPTTPDSGKLARAVHDALTGVLWTDDSRIVDEVNAKRYCAKGEPERVEIEVRLAQAQTVGDLVAMGALDLPRPEPVGFEQLEMAV